MAASSSRVRVLVAVALLGATWRAATADEPVLFLDKVEGGGSVERAVGPADVLAREREGTLDIGFLVAKEILPARFCTLRFNVQTKGVDVDPWTVGTLAAKVDEGRRAIAAWKEVAPTFESLGGLPPGQVPEPARAALEATRKAYEEAREFQREFEALLAWMESRPYLSWSQVAAGERFGEGDSLRTGEGAEAVLRFSTGAVHRVKPGSVFEARRLRVLTPTAAEVTLRLLRGIHEFYVPAGAAGEREFEVETHRVVVGIRGTRFVVTHADGVTTIAVTEGAVEARAAEGGTSTIGAGETRVFGAPPAGADEGDSPFEPLRVLAEHVEKGVNAFLAGTSPAEAFAPWKDETDPDDLAGIRAALAERKASSARMLGLEVAFQFLRGDVDPPVVVCSVGAGLFVSRRRICVMEQSGLMGRPLSPGPDVVALDATEEAVRPIAAAGRALLEALHDEAAPERLVIGPEDAREMIRVLGLRLTDEQTAAFDAQQAESRARLREHMERLVEEVRRVQPDRGLLCVHAASAAVSGEGGQAVGLLNLDLGRSEEDGRLTVSLSGFQPLETGR